MVNGGGFIGVRERNAKEIGKWLMEGRRTDFSKPEMSPRIFANYRKLILNSRKFVDKNCVVKKA